MKDTNIIAFIAQCIAFQNKFGGDNWRLNKKGIYGNEETQQLAKHIELDNWLLHAIHWDLDSVLEDYPELIHGSGGSHVWVADAKTNERIIMIYVEQTNLVCRFESPSLFTKYLKPKQAVTG